MADGRVGKRANMNEFKTVAIRVDASLEIGTGHVMRCLTLADAMRVEGMICQFISRAHLGNLIELIRRRGYEVIALPAEPDQNQFANAVDESVPAHSQWLGCRWRRDAEQTLKALRYTAPDLLVVDHYAIDFRWEEVLRPRVGKMMVIDDLADRRHECDYLLDQNLGRTREDYISLVPTRCVVLIGPRYALLRPEFASIRAYSLARRQPPKLQHLLITMGGVDNQNATTRVLDALNECSLPPDCHITVVLGANSPWQEQVREGAAKMTLPTHVRVGVENMAQLMADSDLAIGAAGSTSWERCCLGLPSLIVVLAENQQEIAQALSCSGASISLSTPFSNDFQAELQRAMIEVRIGSERLSRLSVCAANITDGQGVTNAIQNFKSLDEE